MNGEARRPAILVAGRTGSQSASESKMAGMPRTARVVTWNGKDTPAELRELPAGRSYAGISTARPVICPAFSLA
jgi:hypothetical protein